ncbi:transcription factor Tfb4 [Violaceomyces palustris]|uniref:Transcription factor Tfb4 n=1 Tax=Violaceomyces palustris TaxID=1673888 RepID=A0ACD0NNJ9_9BASI|nr:transcription factor Tfb4 [Violaceomyces palustris]
MPEPSKAPAKSTDVANAGFSHLATKASSGQASKNSTDFLVLIIDVNPLSWASNFSLSSQASIASRELESVLDAILIFLNAHIAMQHENGLAVYAASLGLAKLLFTTAPFASKGDLGGSSEAIKSKPDANTYQHFRHVDNAVLQGIRKMAREVSEKDQTDTASNQATLGIVSAMSQALCQLNRLTMTDQTGSEQSLSGKTPGTLAAKSSMSSRILILSATPDASTQYIPMMNCIFGAQKKGILIDVCKMFGDDTVFLQQASHLTGGSYFRLDEQLGLLQTLMSAYLPSRSIRELLNLPNQDEVDFRAACFCHRKIVDIGYVCSVCLSLFCEPRPQCLTCKSKYPQSTLERFAQENQNRIK